MTARAALVRPMAAGSRSMTALFRYILESSWPHQLALLGLTVTVFLLEVVPLEAQRRVVNDLAKHRPFAAIVTLCALYGGAVLIQGGTKLGLNIYRSWVGECAKRNLRRDVCASAGTNPLALGSDAQGVAVAMIVAEVEPVGAFVGSAISEPVLQAGVLATVIAYIIHLDAWMGVAALALFLPQFVFVPLMQGGMNRRTGMRVSLLRRIGAAVIARRTRAEGCDPDDAAKIDRVLDLNMGIFELKFTMNFLMNLCSHLMAIAALLIGGWRVLQGDLEIGAIVAFISGIARLNDPWGDLVNYFREASLTVVKFRLLETAMSGLADAPAPPAPRASELPAKVSDRS